MKEEKEKETKDLWEKGGLLVEKAVDLIVKKDNPSDNDYLDAWQMLEVSKLMYERVVEIEEDKKQKDKEWSWKRGFFWVLQDS